MMLTIPKPFAKEEQGEEDLVTYLERSTGITLRSLFGIKVAKKILPLVFLGVVFFFWLTTGITQIEPYEHGVLYRLGQCDRILEPGIHLSLPYPFDKVEVYQTEKVQEMVVGYENPDKTNLLWTESHGGTEYKLLLGDGSELVSVNLRIKYKIDDLREYVTCSAEPSQILNAKAYAVVTDLTVKTKLDEILEEDRAGLSQSIEERLAAYLDTAACGLEVCDVIIESIHPPVEVSQVYQQVVSATLEAQAQVDNAQGIAASKISFAELQKNAAIQNANINQNEKVAAAEATVAEFMAMVEAYNAYPDAFCYYKYLNALAKVYQGQRLYIVGDGIDEGYLYFGDGVVIYQKNNKTGG
jgi:regulator of protease activity HflC (stomatin/prohibitin superfamily)